MSRSLLFATATIAALLLAAANKTVHGQPSTAQQTPMIIEPADAEAFKEIIETTIPPRYNRAIIQWYTAILQKQQAKAAAEAQAKEGKKEN
jgi:hypothetical protein